MRNRKETKVNKTELIAEMEDFLESKSTAKAAVESLLNAITGALKKGDSVTIPKFGTFKVKSAAKEKVETPEPVKSSALKPKMFPSHSGKSNERSCQLMVIGFPGWGYRPCPETIWQYGLHYVLSGFPEDHGKNSS